MICGTTYFSPRRGKYNHGNSLHALSLLSHCKRANYQCAIWKRSLEASSQVPSPVGSGWCMEGEDLAIDWAEGLPAPQAVMELLSCDCKKECVQESCTCIQNGLKCTNLSICASWLLVQINHQKMMTIQHISIMTLMTVMMMMRAMTLKQKTLINFDMHKLLA